MTNGQGPTEATGRAVTTFVAVGLMCLFAGVALLLALAVCAMIVYLPSDVAVTRGVATVALGLVAVSTLMAGALMLLDIVERI